MYSQNNEEEIILNYFKEQKGHLLDLGANDGETLSNSLRLIQKGWSADLVEADPVTFEKLHKLHDGNDDVKCHNVAVSNVDGTVVLHRSGSLLGKGDESLVSTLDKRELSRWASVDFTEVYVKSVTFNQLLSMAKKRTFDFITIDIEGMDWIVLKQMDLKALGCKMLIVETNGKETPKYVNYCNKFGMKLLTSNQENIIMVL